MNHLQKSIIKTVAYFDIFNYPMSSAEIRAYLDMPCTEQELNTALLLLTKENVLFKTKEFYQLKHDDSITAERIKANNLAEKQLITAKKIARFLSWFPFIKAIAISGSLSKKIATSKSDYDFFIITEKNCLWLCRFIFSLFIRLASLFGFKKYFCLNYVIDETYLEVQEKNIFTATEILTLMPMYGGKLFTEFFAANRWVYDYFPNYTFIEHNITDSKKNVITRFVEWLMNNKLGQQADNALMRYFKNRWQKLKSKNKTTESGFILGSMMVSKHYCKPYPQNFQQKVLNMHEEKIKKISSIIVLKSVA